MKTLLLLLLSFNVGAATFSYTDPDCASFSMANGVISCSPIVKVPVPPSPQPPPPIIVCPQSITEKLFDYTTPGVTQHLKMNKGQAIAIKFTTDDLVKSGSVQTESSTVGANVHKFTNLSKNKCDFSYTSMDTRTGCSSTGGTATVVLFTTGAPKAGVCTLQKNTTYYANIRNENALPSTARYKTKRGVDTCPARATCGFVAVLY